MRPPVRERKLAKNADAFLASYIIAADFAALRKDPKEARETAKPFSKLTEF
jgi:hypothetical protein